MCLSSLVVLLGLLCRPKFTLDQWRALFILCCPFIGQRDCISRVGQVKTRPYSTVVWDCKLNTAVAIMLLAVENCKQLIIKILINSALDENARVWDPGWMLLVFSSVLMRRCEYIVRPLLPLFSSLFYPSPIVAILSYLDLECFCIRSSK